MTLHDRSSIQGYVIGVADVRPLDPRLVPVRGTVNQLAERWPLIGCARSPDLSASGRANAVPAVADWMSITSPLEANRVRWNLRREHRWRGGFVDVVVEVAWSYGAPYRGGGAFIPAVRVHALSAESSGTGDVDVDLACTVTHPCTIGSIHAPVAALTVSVLGRVRVADAGETVRWALTVRGDGTTTAPELSRRGQTPM